MPLNLCVNFDNLDNVIVTGEEQHMEKLKRKGNIIIDVIEWKIKTVTITDDHIYHHRAHNGIVVMNVTQFLQSNKHISVKMLRSLRLLSSKWASAPKPQLLGYHVPDACSPSPRRCLPEIGRSSASTS